MTAIAQRRPRARATLTDVGTFAWRNVITFRRIPQVVLFGAFQPILFVILLKYVFGGVIRLPGVTYIDFVMPGIFVQVVTFGAMGTAMGVADDTSKGLVDRFRSLPVSSSAMLTGRTVADTCRNVFVLTVAAAVGLLVGFRVHTGPLQFLAAIGILLLFGLAMAWCLAFVGLKAPSSEAAAVMAYPLLVPLLFASSAYVPTGTMPHWVRLFTEHQPISVVATTVRTLLLGGPVRGDLLFSLQWCLYLLILFRSLAVRAYRTRTPK